MDLGEMIGAAAPGGAIIAFRGDLGAGKTTMTKGMALGLGIAETITSPTFTIISEYGGRLRLCHVDAYRLHGIEDFENIGGFEMVSDTLTLCVMEWSERLAGSLPPGTALIDIRVNADGSRSIRLEGDWLERIIDEHSRV